MVCLEKKMESKVLQWHWRNYSGIHPRLSNTAMIIFLWMRAKTCTMPSGQVLLKWCTKVLLGTQPLCMTTSTQGTSGCFTDSNQHLHLSKKNTLDELKNSDPNSEELRNSHRLHQILRNTMKVFFFSSEQVFWATIKYLAPYRSLPPRVAVGNHQMGSGWLLKAGFH